MSSQSPPARNLLRSRWLLAALVALNVYHALLASIGGAPQGDGTHRLPIEVLLALDALMAVLLLGPPGERFAALSERHGRWVGLAVLALVNVYHLIVLSRIGPRLGLSGRAHAPLGAIVALDALVAVAVLGRFVPEPVAAPRPRPGVTRREWLIGGAVGAALAAVFLGAFSVLQRPYFPVAYDQLGSLRSIYESHHELVSGVDLGAAGLTNFKGVVFQTLGLVLVILFGVDRTAVAGANAAFLLLFLACLYSHVRSRDSASAGSFAVGAALLCGSWYGDGGLHDLRLDVAGLVTYGLLVLSLASFDERPDRRRFGWLVGCLVLTLLTRSITAVYALLALGLYGAARIGHGLVVSRRLDDRARATLLVGAAFGVVAVGYLSVYWKDFSSYYGTIASSTKEHGPIRLKEYGVEGRAGLLPFYGSSFLDHFGLLLQVAGIALLGAAGMARRERPAPDGTFVAAVLAAGVTFLGAFITLCASSPSPILIGVVLTPVVLVLASSFGLLSRRLSPRRAWALASLVGAAGLASFVRGVCLPDLAWGKRHLDSVELASANDRLVEAVGALGGRCVEWLVFDQGVSAMVLRIQLHEERRGALAERYVATGLDLLGVSRDELLARARAADAVVMATLPGPHPFDYPIMRDLEAARPELEALLRDEFVRLREVPVHASGNVSAVGYFARPVACVDVLGAAELSRHPADAVFWLGEQPARLVIQNLTSTPQPVRISLRGDEDQPFWLSSEGRRLRADRGSCTISYVAPPGRSLLPIEAAPGAFRTPIWELVVRRDLSAGPR